MKNAGKKQSPLLLTFIIASSNLPQSALEIKQEAVANVRDKQNKKSH